MALPPDQTEAFVREVDENLRREEMEKAARRYGKYAVAAAVAIMLLAGGYLYWRDQQQRAAGTNAETFQAVIDDVGAGKDKTADARLAALADDSGGAMAASARFAQAALAMQAGQAPKALGLYRAIAADGDVPQLQRDLATLRAVSLDFDAMTSDAIIAQLAELAKPGEPFFGSAGEMTAFAYLAKGDKARAAGLFQALARDNDVPAAIRNRSAEMAASMGIDMSSFTPVRNDR